MAVRISLHDGRAYAPDVHATAISIRKERRFRATLQGVAAVVIAGMGIISAGCSSASAGRRIELFVMKAPEPVIVAKGYELAAAENAARLKPGCFAVSGQGTSMEPVYHEGTAVVVRAGGFDQLQPGLPVVYKNSRGIAVAHMLVEYGGTGWIACGLNNDRVDRDLVTPDNLVGIITQAFAAKTGSPPGSVATRIANSEQARRGLVALQRGL